MLKDLLNYGSITTKIKSMESRLIKPEGYYEIAALSSVEEFINYLKKYPSYEAAFKKAEEDRMHREDVELYINMSLHHDYGKIYTFATPKQRKFLKVYAKRYELVLVKGFLRQIFDHRDIAYNTSLFSKQFKKEASVDLDALAACRSLEEFFQVIKGSEYYPILNVLREAGVQTLFDYEFALDIYFFKYLWRLKDKVLKKHELSSISKIYGYEIDLLNILWIYRSKKYYNVDRASIYKNLIPITYKLKPDLLSELVEAESIDGFLKILSSSYYLKIIKRMDTLADPEKLYFLIMDHVQHKAAKEYPYSIATIHYYLYLKGLEIQKLTTALECIRYGLSPAEIAQYII